jgi:hypothetical protein
MEHTSAGDAPSGAPTTVVLAYVEDVGLYFEQNGLPRMAGRIIGWLLVCDPPEQSAGAMAVVLRASKGSISTATRLLVQARLIERVALPGARRDYFRIRPDGWADRVRASVGIVSEFRRLTERGLDLLGPAAAPRCARLEGVHDLYVWLERELPVLLERYERERRGGSR